MANGPVRAGSGGRGDEVGLAGAGREWGPRGRGRAGRGGTGGRGSVGRVRAAGEFVRDTRYLNGRITAGGRDGTLPVEAGRYRLVVARACPWANRTMIVRRLLGLESALSLGMCGPEHDWRSWTFDLDPGGIDPVLGVHWLREAYEKAVPGYDRGVTVPAIVDVTSGAVVTADYREMTLDMGAEWAAYHRPGAPDLYPDRLRDEIEEISAGVYEDLNNGVYKCGRSEERRVGKECR